MSPSTYSSTTRKPLAEKTVVICGASSGIGKATALALAEKGCSLVLAARRFPALEKLSVACRKRGARKVRPIAADVTDAESMARVADAALGLYGTLDIWINNAGLGAVGAYDEIPMEIHEQVIRTNLLGYMKGTYAALPIFKKQNYGILINNISVGGWAPQPYAVAYSAGKFGLRGFSESLRCELRHFEDIHVCDVFPAYIDTPGFQHAANYTGKKLKPMPPVFPAGRVAKAIVKLAQHPKASVHVGETALLFKYLNFLAPRLTRKVASRITENYFKRAKSAPVTEGAVLNPNSPDTGISGGWLQPKKRKRKAVMMTFLVTGLAGVAGFLWAGKKP